MHPRPDRPPAARHWFRAKRYGWGWGLPTAWQGRLVLALFFVLLAAGALWLLPSRGRAAFLLYTALLCVALVSVCWLKGEPPRWRWGKE